MIKVYGIKNCDSVKKALKFFKAHNLEFELHDFKMTPVTSAEISSWLKKTDIKTLFNSKSTTYRNLKLKELNLDEKAQEEYLAKENLLIKRPVVVYGDDVVVGFKEESYKNIFL